MSTFVLHRPDVVVMEMDGQGKTHVFIGITNPKHSVYEFKGRVESRLDDLPPRLRRHWQPHGSDVVDPSTHRENAPDSRDAS